jgi:hypothetical protein
MEKCLDEPSSTGETHKRVVIEVLQALHDTSMPSGEMAHLFIATCMIASDKTIITYAAEIWIQAVQQDTINSHLIGTILGKHQRIEFAPLKHFTDLRQQHARHFFVAQQEPENIAYSNAEGLTTGTSQRTQKAIGDLFRGIASQSFISK